MNNDHDELIILIDENGEEVEAKYVDTIEYRDSKYIVLIPMDENGHDDNFSHGHEHSHGEADCGCEEEVVILKVEQGADGEDETFIAIEDEEEQDAVFAIFTKRMEESEYDGDYDETDDDQNVEDRDDDGKTEDDYYD